MARSDLVEDLVVESGGSLTISSLGNGWPSVVKAIRDDGRALTFDLYISEVSGGTQGAGMARGNLDELRFQNPSSNSAIQVRPDVPAMLLGLELASPRIAVVADAQIRADHETRFSVRFPRWLLEQATEHGWATYESTSSESIRAMHASFVSSAAFALTDGTWPSSHDVHTAVLASGLAEAPDDPAARTRAKRSVEVAIRDSAFGANVRGAYGGRCAICGLKGPGLVVGAHVFPVAAEGAPDTVSNGIALCQNHHAAFDAHLWTINPELGAIVWEPHFKSLSEKEAALGALVGASEEIDVKTWPIDMAWASRRVEHFADNYAWLDEVAICLGVLTWTRSSAWGGAAIADFRLDIRAAIRSADSSASLCSQMRTTIHP